MNLLTAGLVLFALYLFPARRTVFLSEPWQELCEATRAYLMHFVNLLCRVNLRFLP